MHEIFGFLYKLAPLSRNVAYNISFIMYPEWMPPLMEYTSEVNGAEVQSGGSCIGQKQVFFLRL